ncbi:CASP-like protein 1D1 [Cinnamomum micranthum f. kanehirae]|uniref:CASP-like protein n=1 Tax=Cinnamomum micranthum f. kanehirae TaxID=337451 RepID=A0A443PTL3_9MAGN|nr:CASP-like protein 1D1 [Cinnamomum micranthum f. kanehirae]
MASTEQPVDESSKAAVPESKLARGPSFSPIYLLWGDLALRLLLFASTLTGVVVMVTSKQTELLFPFPVTKTAKFNYSPAFIYFVVALSVACLYSILTITASIYFILKPSPSNKLLLLLVSVDALMAVLVASATGASASVAYIGLKGNSHVGWIKVCNIYHKFCRHIASSTALALVASIILLWLVLLSTLSIYRRIR